MMNTPNTGKDNNVVRKTPGEIKKGLELCDGKFLLFYCAECPYNKEKGHCDRDNKEKIKRDALALIEQLERERDAAIAHVKQLRRERDAALEMLISMHCDTCIHGQRDTITNDCSDCIEYCNWEWQGVKEEKDENA